MRFVILLIGLMISVESLYAKSEPSEKSVELKVHLTKMLLNQNKKYELELAESSAVYIADKKHTNCLKEALIKNKNVTLKVTAFSLEVLECKLE